MGLRLFSKGITLTKIRGCTILLLFLGVSSAFAQNPMFKVLAVTGKVIVSKPGVRQTMLRVADELTGSETLQIPVGGRVNLICSNYQSLRLSQMGKWKVGQLEKECRDSQSGPMIKYFHYVWENLLHKHVKPESAPLHFMSNKGAVSRGCPGMRVYYPTDTLKLVQHDWQFYWDKTDSKVAVSLYDSEQEGKRTYSESFSTESLSTSSLLPHLSEEEVNHLEIKPEKGNGCPRFPITKVSTVDFNLLMKSYEADMPEKGTSAYFFTRSLIETDLKFLAEALADLRRAIALDPVNKVYQDHLSIFKNTFYVK